MTEQPSYTEVFIPMPILKDLMQWWTKHGRPKRKKLSGIVLRSHKEPQKIELFEVKKEN